MSSITYTALMERMSRLLVDANFDRWSEDELLDWLGDGERAVVRVRPDACTLNTDINLAAGAKQRLPQDAHRLIDIPRNALGGAIRAIDKGVIDAQHRDWYRAPPTEDIEFFIYSDRDPNTFYVYPPAKANHLVEMVYSVIPPPPMIITGAETIRISDAYAEPMLDYAMYRAWLKDAASSPENAQRAQTHLTAHRTALGDSTNADTVMSPNGNA